MTDTIEIDERIKLRKAVIEFRERYPIRTWLLMRVSKSLHRAEAKRLAVPMSKLTCKWGSNEDL